LSGTTISLVAFGSTVAGAFEVAFRFLTTVGSVVTVDSVTEAVAEAVEAVEGPFRFKTFTGVDMM